MASDGTELSNSLVAVRGWLLATIPEACGLSHDTTILADYTLALLTSIEGTEDQIRAHCLQELEQFFPPGRYLHHSPCIVQH